MKLYKVRSEECESASKKGLALLITNQSQYDPLDPDEITGESGIGFVEVGVFGRTLSNMAI